MMNAMTCPIGRSIGLFTTTSSSSNIQHSDDRQARARRRSGATGSKSIYPRILHTSIMSLVWRCLLQHAADTLARSSHAIAVVGSTVCWFRRVHSAASGCLFLCVVGPRPIHTHIYIYMYIYIRSQAYLFGGENVPRVPVDAHLYTLDLGQAGDGGAVWAKLVRTSLLCWKMWGCLGLVHDHLCTNINRNRS